MPSSVVISLTRVREGQDAASIGIWSPVAVGKCGASSEICERYSVERISVSFKNQVKPIIHLNSEQILNFNAGSKSNAWISLINQAPAGPRNRKGVFVSWTLVQPPSHVCAGDHLYKEAFFLTCAIR